MTVRSRFITVAVTAAAVLALSAGRAVAQISTDIIAANKAGFDRQIADPDQKREGGTQPRDWDYKLAEGITTPEEVMRVSVGD